LIITTKSSRQAGAGSLSGRLAAAFEEMGVDEQVLGKLEKRLLRNQNASRALGKLVGNGIDKTQFLRHLFLLCKAYEEGKRQPLSKVGNRGPYLAALRRLSANVPDCHRLIEKWLLPLFDPSIRTPFLSQEAIAARTLAGANRSRMFSDLKQLLDTLQVLTPVVERLVKGRHGSRYRKAEYSLFGRFAQGIDAERSHTVRKERRVRLEAFCDWCSSNYSGEQLCGNLSPILNEAFDSFDVPIDYPRSAKSLRMFLARRTTRLK
jgi:hypothetical protein